MQPLHRQEGGDGQQCGGIHEGTSVGARRRGGVRPGVGERGDARDRDRGCSHRSEHAVREPQADQGAEPVQERPRHHRHRDQDRRASSRRRADRGDVRPHPATASRPGCAKANERASSGSASSPSSNVDDGGDTARNVTAAQQLVEQEKVFAVMPESAAGDASGQYLHDQGIPAVGWQLGCRCTARTPNFFGMQNANTKRHPDAVTWPSTSRRESSSAPRRSPSSATSTANARRSPSRMPTRRNKTKGVKTRVQDDDIPIGHHRVRRGGRPDQAVGRRHRLHHHGRRRATPGS